MRYIWNRTSWSEMTWYETWQNTRHKVTWNKRNDATFNEASKMNLMKSNGTQWNERNMKWNKMNGTPWNEFNRMNLIKSNGTQWIVKEISSET
jgi:hypothetical protein